MAMESFDQGIGEWELSDVVLAKHGIVAGLMIHTVLSGQKQGRTSHNAWGNYTGED